MERLFQVFNVQSRGQRRNRRRDFDGHRGWDENRLKDRGKKTQLPDSSKRDQRAGIRNDGHSEGTRWIVGIRRSHHRDQDFNLGVFFEMNGFLGLEPAVRSSGATPPRHSTRRSHRLL